MKKLLFVLLSFLCLKGSLRSQPQAGSLQDLNKTIGEAPRYDRQKEARIQELQSTLHQPLSVALYQAHQALYEEYMIFKYDSAYHYARLQLEIARRLQIDSLIQLAAIKQSFILLSSGMFKEAFDSLNAITVNKLPGTMKAEYYTLLGRCYYDLADYDNDRYHSPDYNERGNHLIDLALHYYRPGSFRYMYYSGLKNIRANQQDTALVYFTRLMQDSTLSLHQVALTASTLSDIYIQRGETDRAISLLIRAAVADIRSSTKETAAIFNLATLLYKEGDLKNASAYIEKAVNDAAFYGARQRKVQLSAILPLIEGEKINRVESEKRTVITYATIATVLILLLIALSIIILRQVQTLKKAKQAISEAHAHQQEINARLLEANKIKEEYIGYFFNGNSAFYTRMERFRRNIEKKVQERKLDEIRFLVDQLHIKQEREELLKNFDRIFLKIFPHFIEKYNHLFDPENQVNEPEPSALNTDLRIFALIRLGIHDNEKIAGILGYSVNTINTYKTKIKNKSKVANEDFEARIMQIASV